MQINISLDAGTNTEAPWTHRLLLPIGQKALLSHIIASYPKNTSFYFYGSEYVSHIRTYLELAHPQQVVYFKDAKDFQYTPVSCLDFGRHELIEEYFRTYAQSITADIDTSRTDEIYYKINDRHIQFFRFEKEARMRHMRSQILSLSPKMELLREHFLHYQVKGLSFAERSTPELFDQLLGEMRQNLWRPAQPVSDTFTQICRQFYFENTLKNVEYYLRLTKGEKDIPDWREILSQIPWNSFCSGVPVQFHGQLRFENIYSSKAHSFQLINHGSNFSGEASCGDLYFEFARLYAYLRCPNYNDLTQSVAHHHRYEKLLFKHAAELGLEQRRIHLLGRLIWLNAVPYQTGPVGRELWIKSLTEIKDYLRHQPFANALGT